MRNSPGCCVRPWADFPDRRVARLEPFHLCRWSGSFRCGGRIFEPENRFPLFLKMLRIQRCPSLLAGAVSCRGLKRPEMRAPDPGGEGRARRNLHTSRGGGVCESHCREGGGVATASVGVICAMLRCSTRDDLAYCSCKKGTMPQFSHAFEPGPSRSTFPAPGLFKQEIAEGDDAS